MSPSAEPISSPGPGPVPTPFLEIDGLTRRFGDRVAVDGLSITVAHGEVFGLLGPNGAGKTTAFRLLTGMLRPHAGTVRVDGRPARLEDRAFRARLGVVFQEPSLDRKLSGRQNLALHAALHGVPGAEARERIDAMLDLVALRDRADERVDRYSGGMKRRLDLARVLLHEPDLLVMDEPTAGIDEASFRSLWAHIHGLCASRGMSVLLTTHRPEEAAQCDRLTVLDEGKVIATGTPDELISRVAGDVVEIQAEDQEALCAEIGERLDLSPSVIDGRIRIECAAGHEWVPRIVEAFPAGRMVSVGIHKPDLADVFLHIAGRTLAG
jgi:ABC-2 type transport system ATP-binding protein